MPYSVPRCIAVALLALLAAPAHDAAAAASSATGPSAQAAPDSQLSAVEYEQRKTRIVQFFENQRSGYRAVATTRTKSGQIIDWIRPESQVADGVIATPPSDAEGLPPKGKAYLASVQSKAPGAPASTALTEVQLDESIRGPKGTVPIVRFDVDSYLREVKNLPLDPRQILTKAPPQPSPAANSRYYVVWQRFADVYGTSGFVNIWDTVGPVGNETSIAQAAVIRGTPMQAVEAGKIEHSSFAPSKQPVFFTYFRTNGSASGDWVGGYNALVKGWVQVSATVAPGMSLVPWNSVAGGAQRDVDIEVRLVSGNWWVKAAGQWAGYYPNCKGATAPPCASGTLFSAAGIRDKADRLDWYGEVFDSSAPASTSTDMGSGAFASTQFGHAAYFRNLTYYWAPESFWWWDSGALSVTDSKCYSGLGPSYSADVNWRNWFYYGGPGKEGAGCI
ncbi:neprosin family prolyl endopeptidase [Lysobacter sp. CA199]|uniref:neprosin family prolyl endopeptidase n=1 Tax=Lysobacter sp. CA199 TaxID=3455608 RepID=UPI003F8D31B5